jgi:DUF4097 and DUF4098 domain-containing protein YvlB
MRRLLPLCALLAAACLYTVYATDEVGVCRPAAGLAGLAITTSSGEVSVSGASTDAVSGKALRKAWGRNKADAEQALGTIVIVDTVEGSTMRLSAVMPGQRRPLGCGFTIAIPDTLGLTVDASSSPVSVAGVEGPVTISTSSAPVDVTGTEGELSVTTTSGAIHLLDTEGSATLSTRSAEVRVQVHRGSVDATTSSGPITCEIADLGPLDAARLQTSDGAIDLYLPDDVSARVSCRTTNGLITFQGFTVQFETLTPDTVVGVIGSGASNVELITTNGNITVRSR